MTDLKSEKDYSFAGARDQKHRKFNWIFLCLLSAQWFEGGFL